LRQQLNDKSVLEERSHQELTTVPGPLVIKVLIENSLSDVFDEAKQEWELVTHIPADSEEFVENCELCNHRNYKENWLIQNQNTKALLKVGSDCIKRFIQFAGTSSQADSNTFFENKLKEMDIEVELKLSYFVVIEGLLPTVREANRFKKLTLQLLERKGQLHLIESGFGRLEIIKNLYKQSEPSNEEQIRFGWLMSEPSTLPVQKETKKYKEIKIKEGSTFKKRSKVVRTTLANSKIYRNPEKKYE
jgi:hypothetical protein